MYGLLGATPTDRLARSPAFRQFYARRMQELMPFMSPSAQETFLKNADLEIEELDAIVHKHYEDVTSQIDCCACGNCCRQILPTLDNADVTRLAAGLGATPDDVWAKN